MDLTTKKFSLANALTLALASQAAYIATPTIYNAETDTAVVIDEHPDHTVLTMPGTRNFRDVWMDLQCGRVPRQFGHFEFGVHAGFIKSLVSVLDDTCQALARINSFQAKPLYLGGHSAGGGRVVLLACELFNRGIPFDGIYTYGQPRVVDAEGAKYCENAFGEIHFRLEDGADAITRMPGYFMGNRHSGHCEFMNSVGGCEEDPTIWLKALSDAWEIWRAKQRGPLAILALGDDHHVGNYVRRLITLNTKS